MEIDYSSCPGWWILFLCAPPHKGLDFWKNYIWTCLSFSYSPKITFILIREVISLKKMVVLSVKFTFLISWPPICIPLILLLVLMRLASTSARILYNNLDSWHHWQTHVGVKASDRRQFVLTLDSILLNMWMNLSPNPNFCKAEKIKSTSKILQKDFYSVYLTH